MRRKHWAAGVALTIMASAASAQQPWEHERTLKRTDFFVSPQGADTADGTASHPFRSIERAQQAVRAANTDADVVVTLADGIYTLDRPLSFGVHDGGQEGRSVSWVAAAGAHPVISGGIAVTGWRQHDAARGIYVADVPAGFDSRQLWIDDQIASRASIEISRAKATFDTQGITIDDPALDDLAQAAAQGELEVEGTGFFTDRYSPVDFVRGKTLVMRQPAWRNNIWGYDTISRPVSPEFAKLYLINSLAFLSKPGQWYLDGKAGKLYLIPPAGKTVENIRVVLPRLPYLLSVSGRADQPVRDLTFQGIRFSYTSWLGPSSPEGYANQQSGAYLIGATPNYPADPITDCSWGCRAFETRRNEWSQIPAAVQVSAAERISFDQDIFAHLGQVGIGIGNDPASHASGVGLGARSVSVTRSAFYDLSAGAILAGGVSREAHHPSDPSRANRNLIVRNNRIKSVSKEYKDNSAILSTYVDSALILHNEVSDVPYDGIDIGWGWGMNDVGGNPIYRIAERGYYDHAANLTYDTPTTHRNVVVAYNKVHGAKRLYEDGGAIYNLSASPGTVIAENHVYDIPGKIALYLDEGSKDIMVRDNVVDGAGRWLNDNTVKGSYPLRVTYGNRAVGNWHNTIDIGGVWDAYGDNLIEEDHPVKGQQWPAEARKVIANAGVEPKAGTADYPPMDK